jgi:hypothetical protein
VQVVQAQGDTVQSIRSGATLIVFMLRGPLVLVAASSCGEPASALRRQLELLHGQLVLVVTSGEGARGRGQGEPSDGCAGGITTGRLCTRVYTA